MCVLFIRRNSKSQLDLSKLAAAEATSTSIEVARPVDVPVPIKGKYGHILGSNFKFQKPFLISIFLGVSSPLPCRQVSLYNVIVA